MGDAGLFFVPMFSMGDRLGERKLPKIGVEHRTLEVLTFRVFHLRSFSVGVRGKVILTLFVGVRQFSILSNYNTENDAFFANSSWQMAVGEVDR